MTVRHWVLILLTAALFGSSFLFIKLAVASLPPMSVAAGRAVVGAAVLVLFARAMGARLPPLGRAWLPLIIVGVLTAIIPYATIAVGQTRIASSLGGILFATIPLFTVFAAPIALADERLTAGRIAGALVGLAGVAVVLGPQALAGLSAQLSGAALTLVAAASYALGAIYTRTQSQVPPLVMGSGQLLVAAPVLVALSLVIDSPWHLSLSPGALVAILAVGLVSTAAPVILFFRLVRDIGPARTSLLTFFIPVCAVLLGMFVLGERPGASALAGLALIMAGAVLIARRPAVPRA